MAKAVKKEVAIIEFEKFSIEQLPELQGKKEEIKAVIKSNPVVEIIDNSTYELAKKSRTLSNGQEINENLVFNSIKK